MNETTQMRESENPEATLQACLSWLKLAQAVVLNFWVSAALTWSM
jgi:hypothetical protein